MPGSAVVDIQNSFGAAFIGHLASTVLFGMTVVQTWIYYCTYGARDSKPLKYFVGFVTFMDLIHTILCTYAIYWYLVLNFGNVESLELNVWALDAQAVISTIINAAVQLYYAKRVHKVSQSLICPLIIVALVLVVVALGVYFIVKGTILGRFSSFHSLTWVLCAGMTTGAVADLLITASMCWYLFHMKTGFARTNFIITNLMAYSVNSGLVVSILAGTMTITFLAWQSSLIWMAFNWLMCKAYVNSLLAMLNSRDSLRGHPPTSWYNHGSNPDNEINLPSSQNESSSVSYRPKSGPPGVSVTVHRSTTTDFAREKSDVVEPTLGDLKLDLSIGPLFSQDRTSELSA